VRTLSRLGALGVVVTLASRRRCSPSRGPHQPDHARAAVAVTSSPTVSTSSPIPSTTSATGQGGGRAAAAGGALNPHGRATPGLREN
jgi:hypothetical protein